MISQAHAWLAWTVVIGNGAAGLWALGAHAVDRLRRRELWAFVAVVQVLLFVQVALGTFLLSRVDGDAPQGHTLYGFLTLFAVAILYGYRVQLHHIRFLIYGFGSLFIMGLAIRAMLLDALPVPA